MLIELIEILRQCTMNTGALLLMALIKILPRCIVDTGEPLYDFSRTILSSEDMQMMSHYQITLGHLKTIFKSFAEQSSETTEQGVHLCRVLRESIS